MSAYLPAPAPDPYAPLLALAEAALRCRKDFPADGEMVISLGPEQGGLMIVGFAAPCRFYDSAKFWVKKGDTAACVPERMGELLARIVQHMRTCPGTPLDIGPVEIRVNHAEGN